MQPSGGSKVTARGTLPVLALGWSVREVEGRPEDERETSNGEECRGLLMVGEEQQGGPRERGKARHKCEHPAERLAERYLPFHDRGTLALLIPITCCLGLVTGESENRPGVPAGPGVRESPRWEFGHEGRRAPEAVVLPVGDAARVVGQRP